MTLLQSTINNALFEMMIKWSPASGEADHEWEIIDELYQAAVKEGIHLNTDVKKKYQEFLDSMPVWDEQGRIKVELCPFCGEAAGCRRDTYEISGVDYYSVICGGCGAEGPHKGSAREAVDAWNKRGTK